MTRAVVFSTLAAIADVLGGLIVTAHGRRSTTALNALVAFGGGFMLDGGMAAILLGYLGVHLTQHVLTPHFHFGEETHREAMISRDVGIWALVGLLPHSFFDGVAISSGFLASAELGLLLFVAVILHKVPTGVSLASIMLASGNSVRQTLFAVALIGLATILGAILTPAVGFLAQYGLALAAGVTIYVAASNLIPESQRVHGWLIPSAVFLGVLAFYLARLLLPGG